MFCVEWVDDFYKQKIRLKPKAKVKCLCGDPGKRYVYRNSMLRLRREDHEGLTSHRGQNLELYPKRLPPKVSFLHHVYEFAINFLYVPFSSVKIHTLIIRYLIIIK